MQNNRFLIMSEQKNYSPLFDTSYSDSEEQ